MNIGYSKLDPNNKFSNELNASTCPICGNHIYVDKYCKDFACVDINCPLGHGARKIMDNIKEINNILFLMENQ